MGVTGSCSPIKSATRPMVCIANCKPRAPGSYLPEKKCDVNQSGREYKEKKSNAASCKTYCTSKKMAYYAFEHDKDCGCYANNPCNIQKKKDMGIAGSTDVPGRGAPPHTLPCSDSLPYEQILPHHWVYMYTLSHCPDRFTGCVTHPCRLQLRPGPVRRVYVVGFFE